MSGWSGGTFTRVHDWTEDEANGYNIESARMDAEDDNFEAGINACLHKGGQNNPTANLPMGGFKHTGVGDGTAGTDYATVRQVQEGAWRWPATGITGGSLNAYTLVLSPAPGNYVAGQVFYFKANRTNSGATTLNVNSLGAKSVYSNGAACVGGELVINRVYSVVYDGTVFHLASSGTGSGSSYGGAKVVMSSDQEIPVDSGQYLQYTTEIYDDSDYFTPASGPIITIPTTGRYRVCGVVRWHISGANLGDTVALAELWVNGSQRTEYSTVTAVPSAMTASPYNVQPYINFVWEGTFTQSDYLNVKVTHSNTTGTERSVNGTGSESNSTWLAIERIK